MTHPMSSKETLDFNSSHTINSLSDFETEPFYPSPKNTNKKRRGDDHDLYKDNLKRRRYTPTSEIVTSSPDHDGYQWRKYGEKNIMNSQFSRSYYRCTYSREYNCKATKQVQRQDHSNPALYQVAYFAEHACTKSSMRCDSKSTNPQLLLDFSAMATFSAFDDQSSRSASSNVTESPSNNDLDQLKEFVTSDHGDSAGLDQLGSLWSDSYVLDSMFHEWQVCNFIETLFVTHDS